MTIVTGGRYNGKLEYVTNEYGIEDREVLDMAEHEAAVTADLMEDYRVLYHLESYIRKAQSEGIDAEDVIMKYANGHPDCIIICDEVGCGIVPMSKEEEDAREKTGRIMCALARRAGGIVRVICGNAEKIQFAVSLDKA